MGNGWMQIAIHTACDRRRHAGFLLLRAWQVTVAASRDTRKGRIHFAAFKQARPPVATRQPRPVPSLRPLEFLPQNLPR